MKRKKKAHRSINETVKSKRSHSNLIPQMLFPLIVFVWPFIFLFQLVIPLQGRYLALGNDFYYAYYKYKVYLLSHLAEFKFPLWSPSEAAGYPLYSNPYAQAFYPFNLILALFYKLTGQYTRYDHQIFTIFGLSIFGLGLYFWLKKIHHNGRAVLVSVLIISVSFKVTEILRFTNATHSVAWYPWILLAMTVIFCDKPIRRKLFGAGLFCVSMIFLTTAGYPYYVYYVQFLIVFYLLILSIGPVRRSLLPNVDIKFKPSLLVFGGACLTTILVCAPYLLSIKFLLSQTVDRGGGNFAFSTAHVFNITDTLGSLVFPPAAQTEGWYFISITALLSIVLFLVFPLTQKKEHTDDEKLKGSEKWSGRLFLLGWFILITYITYGKDSYLFKLLWYCWPGFSSLRVWGRLNITLLPVFAWLLVLAYSSLESYFLSGETNKKNKQKVVLKNVSVLVFMSAVILVIQLILYNKGVRDILWRNYFQASLEKYEFFFIFTGIPAFLLLLSVLLFGRRPFSRPLGKKVVIPVLFIAIASIEMWFVGSRSWVYQSDYPAPYYQCPDISTYYMNSFRYKRIPRNDSLSLVPMFNTGLIANWHFRSYVDFLKNTQKEEKEQKYFLGHLDGQKVFFSESLRHDSIRSFLQDSMRFKSIGRPISYDGDELIWDINAAQDGYFCFIDNWDPYWKAYVDGKETQIELLFDTFKAVLLTEGHHRVQFRYEPSLKNVLFNE